MRVMLCRTAHSVLNKRYLLFLRFRFLFNYFTTLTCVKVSEERKTYTQDEPAE